MSGFAVVKKTFKKKKIPFSFLVKRRPSKRRADFKWVSRYLTFGDFMVPKNCSLQQSC